MSTGRSANVTARPRVAARAGAGALRFLGWPGRGAHAASRDRWSRARCGRVRGGARTGLAGPARRVADRLRDRRHGHRARAPDRGVRARARARRSAAWSFALSSALAIGSGIAGSFAAWWAQRLLGCCTWWAWGRRVARSRRRSVRSTASSDSGCGRSRSWSRTRSARQTHALSRPRACAPPPSLRGCVRTSSRTSCSTRSARSPAWSSRIRVRHAS